MFHAFSSISGVLKYFSNIFSNLHVFSNIFESFQAFSCIFPGFSCIFEHFSSIFKHCSSTVPKHGAQARYPGTVLGHPPGHVLTGTLFGGFRRPYSGHTYILACRVLRTHKQWLVGKKRPETDPNPPHAQVFHTPFAVPLSLIYLPPVKYLRYMSLI